MYLDAGERLDWVMWLCDHRTVGRELLLSLIILWWILHFEMGNSANYNGDSDDNDHADRGKGRDKHRGNDGDDAHELHHDMDQKSASRIQSSQAKASGGGVSSG